MMIRNGSVKLIGRPPYLIFKMKFLMGGALETRVLHHRVKFCGDRSCCCSDIALFRVFQVKCKTPVDDRTSYNITLSKLKIIE